MTTTHYSLWLVVWVLVFIFFFYMLAIDCIFRCKYILTMWTVNRCHCYIRFKCLPNINNSRTILSYKYRQIQSMFRLEWFKAILLYKNMLVCSFVCPSYLIRALILCHSHLLLLLNHVVIVVKLRCVEGLIESNKHSR